MSTLFFMFLSFVLLVFILDRIGLWLEKKGIIYYRKRKPQGSSIMSESLLELQNVVNPSNRNVVEMKQNISVQESKSESRSDKPKT